MIREVSDSTSDAQAYAWNWFALHAGQRMQLVNFWLVAVTFFGAAYVQARIGRMPAVAAGVCIAGAVASIGFALLDARTRQLVQVAEAALLRLEDARASTEDNISPRLIEAARDARASRLFSYRFIIEGMQLSLTLFVIAGILTIAGH
ncbi:hypothetical protein [Nocardia alni]|uniref:hypothetical protein n=1 Tax=Nocardia alni TaxID=2815723 RepID=UPI001C24AAEF|nr:hypothetical protein [Nocardia alni]